MFQLEFMRRAFLVGIMLSIVIPCIGVVMVNKRNSMIGDALSHVSLAGVTIGLIFRVNPIITAIISCAVASFSIEIMRRYFPKNSDISTAIIMSLGIGLAAVLSDFVKGAANFNSFLFGSIVAISDFEVMLVTLVFIVVMVAFVVLYKALLYVSFDEVGARLAGIKVQAVNIVFTFLISLTISIASRTVGVLMVSSLMVVPVACALRLSKSYLQTVIYSVLFGTIFTISGITISFYRGLKPGGTMVLTGIVVLVAIVILQNLKKFLKI
ncbi:metal ABC transporter permease [uncultured Parvimonas sp.]|uniref:metal ABC transporter permease n=1 Tax=uncultured Parvimonas sp. TaxID=747372 RepID=UPI002595B629|nr:metal ABC transporter permease [uncultured Parvimonas sp.]